MSSLISPSSSAAQQKLKRTTSAASGPIADELVDAFILKLKRRELLGSNAVALQTADLLRTLISRKKFTSVSELLESMRAVGAALTAAHPIELCIGNIVRRVLYIIRHEAAAIVKELQSEGGDNSQQQTNVDLSLSLHKILDAQQLELNLDLATISSRLKPQVRLTPQALRVQKTCFLATCFISHSLSPFQFFVICRCR